MFGCDILCLACTLVCAHAETIKTVLRTLVLFENAIQICLLKVSTSVLK